MAIRDKQPDADAGRKIVDEQLENLEARLTSMYGTAAKEMTIDLNKFLEKYYDKDKEKKAEIDSITDADERKQAEKEYEDWKNRQIFRTRAMQAKIDDLTARAVNADKQAMAMVNDQLPETYATSYNFGGFRGETYANAAGFDYTQFTIINQEAVKTLMKDDPDLIPWKTTPDIEEDKKWNRKHIQEAIQQGIVKGDSMDKVAERLLPVVNMDKNAAIRTARTAVNGIENKGRKDATERVKNAGIPMVEKWSCTHDDRTRDTHILLDQTLPNEKGLFGEGIINKLLQYPGDPAGDPEEVYNCRCGLSSTIEGIDHNKDDELYAQMMQEEYYEDWLKVKASTDEKEAAFQAKKEGAAERVAEKRALEKLPSTSELLPTEDLTSGKREVVQGKDISGTWERREDQFKFEIEDVIDAQGFNGLPKIVDEEEFKKAVAESNFIAQRSYSAPNQDTLDSYRDMLYNGDWYVDCSTGGAQYGQGMYCAASYQESDIMEYATFGDIPTGIQEEMEHYKSIYENTVPTDELRNEAESKIYDSVVTITKGDTLEKYHEYIDGYDFKSGRWKDDFIPEALSLKENNPDLYDKIYYKVIKKAEEDYDKKVDAMHYLSREELGQQFGLKISETMPNYTETLTLTSDAKIITYDELKEMNLKEKESIKNEYVDKALTEVLKSKDLENDDAAITFLNFQTQTNNVSWDEAAKAHDKLEKEGKLQDVNSLLKDANEAKNKALSDGLEKIKKDGYRFDDLGVYAASKGYDAINAEGHGESNSYTVILNRTKVIIKRDK